MSDLTKAVLFSSYDAFKNNNVFTSTFTISGTASGGTNVKTFTFNFGITPDMTDIVLNGPSNATYDSRPDNGWFKEGAIWVRGDNAGAGYNNYPTPWVIATSITGTVLTITAQYVQTFSDVLTLTSTNFSIKVVDYSIF